MTFFTYLFHINQPSSVFLPCFVKSLKQRRQLKITFTSFCLFQGWVSLCYAFSCDLTLFIICHNNKKIHWFGKSFSIVTASVNTVWWPGNIKRHLKIIWWINQHLHVGRHFKFMISWSETQSKVAWHGAIEEKRLWAVPLSDSLASVKREQAEMGQAEVSREAEE